MSKTRNNHYVPQWYQKGFLSSASNKLHYLNLSPDTKKLPDGRVITFNNRDQFPPSKCFYQTDLYTTFFGDYINDDIEKLLFGKVDCSGAKAIRAFIETDTGSWHDSFFNFFSYIDTQKIRTPKGLDWIRLNYPDLNQVDLMLEMQSIRNLHCTLWTEAVREIVSAENSDIKFIISDHPVTIYNYACPPDSELCNYPNDPSIALKASQTIFPLDQNHCLILTNLEYAKAPDTVNPTEKRTHAKFMRQSMVRTDKVIRTRKLINDDVIAINLLLKSRAKKYIAASEEQWLYPEEHYNSGWSEIKNILLPPKRELHHFGGEIYVGYKDGSTYHQDAFGRKYPENEHLKKENNKEKIGRNDPCGCGSGKKFKKCCEGKSEKERPSWNVLSIRERNIILYRGVYDILGLSKGKTWDDVRRELSNGQIVDIYMLYWSLWPIETDFISLLPPPDITLRVIYTGVLDPRTILLVLGAIPYFDEILIQHPFIHPKAANPEFSPIENPHQHKYQTLKNLLLFMQLEPFVRAGVVNFIPDPCMFDNFLHREMLRMATARRGVQKINTEEKKRMFALYNDDLAKTLKGLPKEQLVHQINKASPDLSPEEVDDVIKYMKEQNEEDPLALLQDNLFADGGQLITSSMAPNFEMALFIAQVTGSAILTDSPTRWEEISSAQYRDKGIAGHLWNELTSIMSTKNFVFNINPNEYLAHETHNGNFGNIKKLFREVLNEAKNCQSNPNQERTDTLSMDFLKAFKSAEKAHDGQEDYLLRVKMIFLTPKGGFVHKNVQRLLLKSESENHLRSTPMAIFFEPIDW